MLKFTDELENLIIDLGLLPVALCTPTLIAKIDQEFRNNLECDMFTDLQKEQAISFLKHFGHRSRNDKYYKAQSKLFAPQQRFIEFIPDVCSTFDDNNKGG